MQQIYKIRANQVIDFAAEELKKYLRIMMPTKGTERYFDFTLAASSNIIIVKRMPAIDQ